jgi:RNA polymerase sigma factor FliA
MRAYLAEINELSREERERLIIEQLPQVNLIARRLHDKLPGNVSLDDLVSTGVVGLISAIDNFDPNQGVKLKTYAEYKIRGAILDSLRGLDWASRYRRKKAKQIEAAICQAEQRLKRLPNEDEVAAEMGLTLEEYQARLVEVQGLNLESLEVTVGPTGEQTLLSLVPDADELPSETFERQELERLLAEAIDSMPTLEKTILALYYQEELTLREISDILDMRISRISELKSHSILKLRARIREQWPTPRGR